MYVGSSLRPMTDHHVGLRIGSERAGVFLWSLGHGKHVRLKSNAPPFPRGLGQPLVCDRTWRLTLPFLRIMIFIITILLLAADFYYLKNIAGRRLVGLRWWNEVDPQTGESKWVFESSEPGTKVVNATDSRFFWLSLYVQPLLWILLAVLAIVRLQFLWLPLVIIALVLTIMNTLAFSRCDKFSQASNLAGSALGTTNLAGSIATNLAGRWFSRN
ncbi:Golgi apparatus membrane protein tvp-23 [Metarhizium acridum CQMa 102]|uniref:Golgi apparatus membrane protein TVP23 n=1 Tax=Metarhizium acridum (strain CQMa 102) TaxID=655827 RepID=E9E1K2_METAQ|nr:Golgi apparatus membrane protein tvp-23 [Metarhizium acridum CQMa 102]EFY90235.1 Golgi apparatus membrane protein tvp-23 [Metarhizium acridum CQMa 102]